MSLETGGSPIFRGLMQERYGASPDLASPVLQAALYQEEHAIAVRRTPALEAVQEPAEPVAPAPHQRQLGLQEGSDGSWEPLCRDVTPPSPDTIRQMTETSGLLGLLALSDHPQANALKVLHTFQQHRTPLLPEQPDRYPHLIQEPAW